MSKHSPNEIEAKCPSLYKYGYSSYIGSVETHYSSYACEPSWPVPLTCIDQMKWIPTAVLVVDTPPEYPFANYFPDSVYDELKKLKLERDTKLEQIQQCSEHGCCCFQESGIQESERMPELEDDI